MSFVKVIAGFVRKEFRQLLRSREMLVVLFGLPLVQLLLMGFAVTNEVKNVRVCFFDHDRSNLSRELVSAFASTDRFLVVPSADTDTPESVLKSWRAQVSVVIPRDFGKDLSSLRRPSLQIVSDGIDGNSASIANSYVLAVTQNYLEKYLRSRDPSFLARFTKSSGSTQLIPRMLYNPDLRSSVNIVPGIIAILVTVTSMMLSALALVREKEMGTLEQLLVTPVSKWELLTGKLIPYLMLTFAQTLVAMAFARVIFGTQVAGSIWLLLGFAGLYFFTTVGLGILISILVSSQQQAMFFAWFVMIVLIMLSGFFIPIQSMPDIVKTFTEFNPMRHFVKIVREIVIKGTPFSALLKEFFILLGTGLTLFSLSVASFRKKI